LLLSLSNAHCNSNLILHHKSSVANDLEFVPNGNRNRVCDSSTQLQPGPMDDRRGLHHVYHPIITKRASRQRIVAECMATLEGEYNETDIHGWKGQTDVD
jgi:hypothetical protein